MGKVIAVVNQKGGVGKTFTTSTVGHELAKLGKKVLLVDGDPQANLTFCLGVNFNELDYTLTELMEAVMDQEEPDPKAVIVKTQYGTDLLPNSIYMADLELKLMSAIQREYVIKKALAPVLDDYDYILIDCPPSLGLFLVDMLTAADEVLIPVSADILGTIGMGQLVQSIRRTVQTTNPSLKIRGILFTLVQQNTKDARIIMDDVRSEFGTRCKVFETTIPQSTEAKKAVTARTPITFYNRNCSIAQSYRRFVQNEFIKEDD